MPQKPSPKAADDREQADLVLREQEAGHRRGLPRRADQHRGQAADAVGDRAPDLPAEEGGAEQHRQHDGADRAGDAEIAAEGDQMLLRHRHRHAAQDRRRAHHREHEVGRPAEHRALRLPSRATPRPDGSLPAACGKRSRERHDHHDLDDRIASAWSARQPSCAMTRSKIGGHIAPAR